jgi:hypothetical protein
MDYVRPFAESGKKHSPEEKEIESDLMQRRAYLVLFAEGDARGATDVEPGHVVSVVVGAHPYLVAQPLQHPCFLKYSNRAPIVGKERSGGDHQHGV